jgi:Fe-S-cluster containining protein
VSQPTAYQKTAGLLREQLREAVIDHVAFEQKIQTCELSNCRATCCHDGVYLSEEEAVGVRDLIDENPDLASKLPTEPIIETRGGKSQKTATREAEPGELAEDYPEHFPKTRCVFLDREGRCKIQMLSVEQGRHPWFNKPLTCWIHPLVILPANRERSRPVLTLVSPENDPQKSDRYPGFASCTHCGRPDEGGKKARQVLAAELEMLGLVSGRDILGELNAESV